MITAKSVKEYARGLGADMAGVSSAGRLDELAAQLKPLYEGEVLWNAVDRSVLFTPYHPDITPEPRAIKTASDHLPGARSVLVFGLRLHGEVLRHVGRPLPSRASFTVRQRLGSDPGTGS